MLFILFIPGLFYDFLRLLRLLAAKFQLFLEEIICHFTLDTFWFIIEIPGKEMSNRLKNGE